MARWSTSQREGGDTGGAPVGQVVGGGGGCTRPRLQSSQHLTRGAPVGGRGRGWLY